MYEDILTKDFLENEYNIKKKPKIRIAKEVGTTIKTVNKYCSLHSIETNTRSDYVSENLVGQKFERLLVLEKADSDKHGKVKYTCSCSCGSKVVVNASSLLRGLSRSCGCIRSEIGRRKGYKDISWCHWRRIASAAETRGYSFNITPEDVWHQYEKQQRKCALSQLEIAFYPNYNKLYNQTASIDRIDCHVGYEVSNIQIVHKVINLMKNQLGNEEFIAYCNMVAKNNERSHETCKEGTTRTILRKI